MTKIALTTALAAAVLMPAPLLVGSTPAELSSLQRFRPQKSQRQCSGTWLPSPTDRLSLTSNQYGRGRNHNPSNERGQTRE